MDLQVTNMAALINKDVRSELDTIISSLEDRLNDNIQETNIYCNELYNKIEESNNTMNLGESCFENKQNNISMGNREINLN